MSKEPPKPSSRDFVEGSKKDRPGLLREMFSFIVEGKKWWLTPIIAILLLLGLFIVLGGSAAAPFIYTLF